MRAVWNMDMKRAQLSRHVVRVYTVDEYNHKRLLPFLLFIFLEKGAPQKYFAQKGLPPSPFVHTFKSDPGRLFKIKINTGRKKSEINHYDSRSRRHHGG